MSSPSDAGVPGDAPDLPTALRALVPEAMRARDRTLLAAVRVTLAALANAEAVTPPPTSPTRMADAHVAGSRPGLGAAEVPRRALSTSEQVAIVAGEVADLRTAADRAQATGRPGAASTARAAERIAAVLEHWAGPGGGSPRGPDTGPGARLP